MMVKEKKESYEVVEVSTQTEPRIKDNETEETYTLIEAINVILNELKNLRRAVG